MIKVLSEPGEGTRIEMCFPRCLANEVEIQPVEVSVVSDTKGEERILAVDDEPALLGMVEEMLSLQGYDAICAGSAEEALGILENETVDLILSDVIMPGMDGYELASIVQEKYPDIQIQLASGFTDGRNDSVIDDELRKSLIYKPYTSETLLRRLRELFAED